MKKLPKKLERINEGLFKQLPPEAIGLVFGGAAQLSFEQCGADKIDVTIDADT